MNISDDDFSTGPKNILPSVIRVGFADQQRVNAEPTIIEFKE